MANENLTPVLISGVSCYEQDGTAYLRLEDVSRGLGFTQTQNKGGVEYTSIRWERVEQYLAEIGFPHKWGKDDFIPENIFYRLAMKAKNETAENYTDALLGVLMSLWTLIDKFSDEIYEEVKDHE